MANGNTGIEGLARGSATNNIGVRGEAQGSGSDNTGIFGSASGDSSNLNTGVFGIADGEECVLNIGLNGLALNGDVNFGVFGAIGGEGAGVRGSASIANGITVNYASGVDAFIYTDIGATINNATALSSTWETNGTVTYGRGLFVGDVDAVHQTGIYQEGTDDTNYFYGLTQTAHVIPITDNTYDLGSSSNRWDDVWATNGTIQTSDMRMKANIEELPYGLEQVLALKPISFTWKDNPERGRKVGLGAQQVKEVIKEVVVEGSDKDHRLGINYGELVPVLVKAIQEQQAIINEQKLKTEQLERLITGCCALKSEGATGSLPSNMNNSTISVEQARLEQNIPNPFSQKTDIRFYLPETIESATLLIYDLKGSVIRNIRIHERNYGKVEIKAGELMPGVYFYSLITDTSMVDTKTMIVTN
ncbi:MAG: hypothetical protein KatS3mg031_2342 [Chitinophagales bacterium]|nr:MAG: hypothetical protein KatS3mg031_2342 [Chitinophagales bacterium]